VRGPLGACLDFVALFADLPIMDVCNVFGPVRIVGSLLVLAASCHMAGAEDSTVEASDQSSTIVVTASDGDAAPEPEEPTNSQLVICADDSDPTPAEAQTAPETEGSLTVVANSQRQQPLSAIEVDPAVQPAAMRAQASAAQQRRPSGMFSGSPRRPGGNTGLQTRPAATRSAASPVSQLQSNSRPQPRKRGAVELEKGDASNAAPARPQSVGATKSAAGHGAQAAASELLVQAYQLSLTASTEAEYSQIVRCCAEATRQGLEGENRTFALSLSAWSLNRRGQIRADQGQREIAIADFRAALEFDPQCWRALHNRGVTLAQCGHFAEAFDDISKVIELNPQFAKAYSNRGTLYVQAGQYEKAIADFDAALKLDSTLLPALVGRGRVCHLMGRLDEALVNLSDAIEQDGTDADVICSRGDLLVDLGEYNEALDDYARAIDLNPKLQHAYRNGAWLLATCPDESIRDVEGALKGAKAALECGYGERHAALDTMAAALANAGRYDEAVATMQQAIQIAPQEAVPDYQARQQLYQSGQPFRTQPIETDVQAVEFVEG
jgi:tetratricopeptide (TPR) repeat protein